MTVSYKWLNSYQSVSLSPWLDLDRRKVLAISGYELTADIACSLGNEGILGLGSCSLFWSCRGELAPQLGQKFTDTPQLLYIIPFCLMAGNTDSWKYCFRKNYKPASSNSEVVSRMSAEEFRSFSAYWRDTRIQ